MTTDIAKLGLEVDSSGFVRAIQPMDNFKRKGREVEQSSQAMTQGFNAMRTAVGLATAAIGGLTVGRVVSQFASFEQGMRNVAAVSGATAAELDQLTASALAAASSTRFNPEQTTQALYALASSGQSATQQMASLVNVLNLAEAAGAGLGQTTELMTSTLNQFGLSANQSARVADVFTASIGASALNVDRLSVAMRNAAPTAAALNQTLEGTTAIVGTLTTAFGNGERAGTGLRAILDELPKQAHELGIAVRDANGQFRPLVDILEDLERQGYTSGQAVADFGAQAGPALAALLRNGSIALREMEAGLTSAGQAADTAGKQMDTLKGDLDGFASAVDVALVKIGDSQSGVLRNTTQTVTNLVRLWSGYGDSLGDARASTIALSVAVQATGAGIATMGALAIAIRGATTAQLLFNAAARANPYALIAAGAVAATVAIIQMRRANEDVLEVFRSATDSASAYEAAQDRLGELERARADAMREMNRQQERINQLNAEQTKRYMREPWRLAAIEDAEDKLNQARDRYQQLGEARLQADLANYQRQNQARQEALEEERSAAEEAKRIQDEARAAQARIDAAELEARRLSATERLTQLRGQLDAEEAVQIEYRRRMQAIEEAWAVGAIQDAEARAAIEREVERDRLEQLNALRRDSEAEFRRQRAQDIASSAMQSGDPEMLRIQAQIDFLKEARDEQLEIEADYDAALAELERARADRQQQLSDQAIERAKREANTIRMAYAGAISAALGLFNQLSSNRIQAEQRALDSTENATEAEIKAREKSAKAAFDNGKKLQLGMVGVNTAAAIMNELATNPLPFAKWANVTAIGLTGATQAAAIAGSEFGGLSTPSVPSAPTQDNSVGDTSINNQITINVTGADGNIVEQLQDFFSRDGVLINPDSTQGRALRG